MPRHRCTKCRNPIRRAAVTRHSSGEDAWFHPDCWDEVCRSQQERYERRVESAGISALLAPYGKSAAANATLLVTEPQTDHPSEPAGDPTAAPTSDAPAIPEQPGTPDPEVSGAADDEPPADEENRGAPATELFRPGLA